MSILVTGGAGYIGSHTIRELQKAGREVIVYDNLSKGHRQAVGNVHLVEGSLDDSVLLLRTVETNGVTGIIHFAASIAVGESMKDPQQYYLNNVYGTLCLLNVMLTAGIRSIVFSSTAAVYGNPEQIPITEDASLKPTSTYGRTKLMMEQILADYARAYGVRYVALRYFNVAGADPTGDIGEDHYPETHLIPLIMKTLLGQRESFSLFGTDYPTEDGTCVRDYIHVVDLAEAHVLALDWIKSNEQSGIFNLGNGNGFSNRQIIRTVERVTGKTLDPREEGRRPGDPAILIAGSQKAKAELGWKPRFNNLDTIVKTAWNWHSSHPTGYES